MVGACVYIPLGVVDWDFFVPPGCGSRVATTPMAFDSPCITLDYLPLLKLGSCWYLIAHIIETCFCISPWSICCITVILMLGFIFLGNKFYSLHVSSDAGSEFPTALGFSGRVAGTSWLWSPHASPWSFFFCPLTFIFTYCICLGWWIESLLSSSFSSRVAGSWMILWTQYFSPGWHFITLLNPGNISSNISFTLFIARFPWVVDWDSL